jgi:hypothetical protein
MDTRIVAAIIIGLVALVVIVGISMLAHSRRRTERLRRQFGPEYERLVAEKRGRRRAEAELEARLQRVKALHIREIDPAKRMQLAESWQAIQARFADDPPGAVAAAERLVKEALEARGYSVRDLDQCMADLTVFHAKSAGDYRRARDISSRAEEGHVTTEDLRQAIMSYRAVFEDVLEERVTSLESRRERAA